MREASLVNKCRLSVGALAVALVGCSAGSGSRPGGSDPGGGFGAGPSASGGGAPYLGGSGGDPNILGPGTGTGGTPATMPSAQPPPLTNTPVSIDECLPTNAAGLDATAVQKLEAGSGNPGGLRLENPYDGTVFPRGLIAPLLMWSGGGTADLAYLHIKSSTFEYKGCLKPTGPNQLQIPQGIWDQATAHAGGPKDPFTLELTTSLAGTATGPVVETIIVAQATLKGTIFYNSYKSKLVQPTDPIGVFTGGQGAVLRLVPGKQADVFLGQTSCTGCHSVSVSGTRMVANPQAGLSTMGGATYQIGVGAPPNPTPLVANALSGSFSGVSPDGSLYLTNAHPAAGVGPRAGGPGAGGDPGAVLYETDTGVAVSNTGIPAGVMTPMFSPKGTSLVFNDYAIANGHGMATMTFDPATRKATGYKQVFQVADTTQYPGWPFFLPDEKGLVFAVGSASDFSGMATGLDVLGIPTGASATSDLYILDLASGTGKLLARAIGFASEQDAQSNTTYLPFGLEELHHNFYPTVSPVAAGGYFWVFFDSFRHYGNTHANGLVRQLWGTAVDISPDGTHAADPSHPAFYLTGQEDVAGNHRAFAALDPCKNDGGACTTGIDCCGGFCTNGLCAAPPPPAMGPPPCAHTDEKCATAADCCDSANHCINGFCGQILH